MQDLQDAEDELMMQEDGSLVPYPFVTTLPATQLSLFLWSFLANLTAHNIPGFDSGHSSCAVEMHTVSA